MARTKQRDPAPAARPTAFSYLRFSSPEQAKGDSVRRQTSLRDAWIEKVGAVLDVSLGLTDAGVSAFTGRHRENPDRHALAAFLELVKRGRIPRGSFLILESLDRLTREHIRPALTLLLNLIDAGVRVVQLLPVEAVYDENVEPMSLMVAIMELSRGHAESRMKSERVGAAWRALKRQAADGVPITRAVPSWLRVVDDKFELIPERAAAVRRVFEMATAGHGIGVITKQLNASGSPPIGRAKHWAKSYVAKILASRATFGEYQPHRGHVGPNRKPDGPPIPNYFPAVVTEDQWHAAQSSLAGRKNRGGRPSRKIWIFSGILRDARDGGSLHIVNKGAKSSGPALVSYKAAQGIKDAVYVSFPAEIFERAILSELREIDPRAVLPEGDEAANRVAALAGRYADREARVKAIQHQLVEGGELGPLVEVLRTIDAERVAVGEELAAARRELSSPVAAALGECRSLVDVIDTADDGGETRTRLRTAVRRVVESVHCLFVARGMIRIAAAQVYFCGGRSRAYLVVNRTPGGSVPKTPPLVGSLKELEGIDLRDPPQARAVEKVLKEIDLDTLRMSLDKKASGPVSPDASASASRPASSPPASASSPTPAKRAARPRAGPLRHRKR